MFSAASNTINKVCVSNPVAVVDNNNTNKGNTPSLSDIALDHQRAFYAWSADRDKGIKRSFQSYCKL